MKVLLIGSGAREHALGWKLVESVLVDELISLPGNPGLAELGEVRGEVEPADTRTVAQLAEAQRVDLVVVGPEEPLAAGLVDELSDIGVAAFGPDRAAARLEGSKAFAKEIMRRAGVATAVGEVFRDRQDAVRALQSQPGPYVVKADGLAGGKGVLVTDDLQAATAWVDRCFRGGFGEAGQKLLIEEYLEGAELSVFALCDGKDAALLGTARDYKRLKDGDGGPNTGGMGSFSPVPDLPSGISHQVLDEVIRPVLGVMHDRGTPYVGFIYVGLILTGAGIKVLEFNVRMGDPEAQVVLPRLENDLVELIKAGLDGSIGGTSVHLSPMSAVNVVLASHGYPHSPRLGDRIVGIAEAEAVPGSLVLHAGTARVGGRLETNGGRVVNVVGTGGTVGEARRTAYRAASHIWWEGIQFRTDIAQDAA